MTAYTPAGVALKAINHLRIHPPGTWLSTGVIAEAVGEHTGTISAFLKLPTERQWLRRRKQGHLCYWALGPVALGLPPEHRASRRRATPRPCSRPSCPPANGRRRTVP